MSWVGCTEEVGMVQRLEWNRQHGETLGNDRTHIVSTDSFTGIINEEFAKQIKRLSTGGTEQEFERGLGEVTKGRIVRQRRMSL
jgi:hypothetical protein